MLQDEMTFQRIEVLLDMQAKKITAELTKLREELSQVKEELRKEIHAKQDTQFQQAGPARVQMYADVPPHQEAAPVPRYAQQEAPRYAEQQYQAAPQYPPHQQGYGQPVYAEAMPRGQQSHERAPETKPIDRNGVAPADVSVEKFFNFSGKAPGAKR